MKTTKTTVACLVAAGILVILLLTPMSCAMMSAVIGMGQIRKVESAMGEAKVYEPVAQTLALYCQSDRSLFPEYLGHAWLPQELNRLGEGWATVHTNSAHIELGGGFHHFGYALVRDADHSGAGTNVWQLYLYSEGSKERHLYTLALPVQAQLLSEQLLQRVLAGYDDQLRRHPKDERAHKGKIQAYLRFNHIPEARQACQAMLHAMPDHWWAVLVNALLLAEEQSVDRGAEVMTQWVSKDENFFRYMDLAYFYHLTQRPREAARAIKKSTDFSASTLWGEGVNAEARGYTAAMCAYRAGDYEASMQLCDHLLPVRVNGSYAKRGLRDLRAASARALHGQADNLAWASEILPFDAFEDVDIAKLLAREVPRPTRER